MNSLPMVFSSSTISGGRLLTWLRRKHWSAFSKKYWASNIPTISVVFNRNAIHILQTGGCARLLKRAGEQASTNFVAFAPKYPKTVRTGGIADIQWS